MGWEWRGAGGILGVQEGDRGENSPGFPGAPAREEEESQGCLGTVGAARVGAQGEGKRTPQKLLNKPDQSFGSGQGEQLPPGPSRFPTIWDRAKMPHFERHKPFNGVFLTLVLFCISSCWY